MSYSCINCKDDPVKSCGTCNVCHHCKNRHDISIVLWCEKCEIGFCNRCNDKYGSYYNDSFHCTVCVNATSNCKQCETDCTYNPLTSCRACQKEVCNKCIPCDDNICDCCDTYTCPTCIDIYKQCENPTCNLFKLKFSEPIKL
jgi:hypothetical protein